MTNKAKIIFSIFSVLALFGIVAHAEEGTPLNLPPKEAKRATSFPKGPEAPLYSVYCFGCHGQAKRGKGPTLIRNAMENNTGGMGYLKALSSEQLEAISHGR